MSKRLLESFRKFHLLKLLLVFHGMAIIILAAFYYSQGHKLWHAALVVMIGGKTPVYPVRGPALLLPWNLLPHDVAWLALDALVFGTLTVCVAYWLASDEARKRVAGRERAADVEMQEAQRRAAEAERHMKMAMAREESARAAEQTAVDRDLAAAMREAAAQAHIEGKDVEVKKMSEALTRLKRQSRDLRQEVRQLRQTLDERQEKG